MKNTTRKKTAKAPGQTVVVPVKMLRELLRGLDAVGRGLDAMDKRLDRWDATIERLKARPA